MRDILQKIKNFFLNMREGEIFTIWAAVIILSGSLLWAFTSNLRNVITLRAVNQVLLEAGEDKRVVSIIKPWGQNGKALQAGIWCILNNREKAIIFPLVVDGTFSPCLGIINGEGNLSNIVPLSTNSKTVIGRMSADVLQIWVERVQNSAAHIKG
ncbi:MAG: hypothetical protein Ta2G_13220 [Termitinemataceae bacterium]|nr:MAG: hypothetical protein Ta2G_13220 [Termitinemataceae bacterium]